MSSIPLTPAQHAILAKAINENDGKIEWFPDHIKGGARQKVLDGLFNRVLVVKIDGQYVVAAEGYDALGMKRPGASQRPKSKFESKLDTIIANAEGAHAAPDASLEADVAAAEASFTPSAKTPRTRENSKQAEVVRMLQRPEGATIRQICEATGWQAHTVRGTLAGALKKKLGLTIGSDKVAGGERVYRVA